MASIAKVPPFMIIEIHAPHLHVDEAAYNCAREVSTLCDERQRTICGTCRKGQNKQEDSAYVFTTASDWREFRDAGGTN